jgi:hypothetical protein
MITDEIEAARKALALSDDEFRRLPESEAKEIYESTEAVRFDRWVRAAPLMLVVRRLRVE